MLERWARRPTSAQALALRCRIVLAAADGRVEQGDRGASWAVTRTTVGKWRGRFAAARPRRAARRAAAGQAAHDQRRGRRAGDRQDARGAAGGRDALVDAVDGGRDRDEPDRGQPDLAGVRAQAASDRDVQALARSAVHRQGPRHRRAVPQPARGRGRAVRRREVPDPGARPHGADPAADARGARARRPTTTSATAPPTSTPRSTSPPAR